MADELEMDLGDYVLRLDGTVVEVLSAWGSVDRFHVNHVAVDAKPKRDGPLEVHVGVRSSGKVIEGTRFDVPPERQSELTAFFDEAKRRRTRITPD